MFVSGFTFVRNAVRYDYPVTESIRSLLPLVDELIVCIGNSDDDTETLIHSIHDPKIKIIHSIWDDSLREGGKVLAEETNKALNAVDEKSDWAIYLQADEVFHEQDYATIREAMNTYADNPEVEGLLFRYNHFYGSYDYLGDSRRWYRHEVRIIRPGHDIRSYRDAQGFRKNNHKLHVKKIDATVYHYGWVKNPLHQLEKQLSFHKLWHGDEWVKQNVAVQSFDYSVTDSLIKFTGTHPLTMQTRIALVNWKFDFDPTKKRMKLKDSILHTIEHLTGYRFFEYRNYKLI